MVNFIFDEKTCCICWFLMGNEGKVPIVFWHEKKRQMKF